MTSCKGTQSCNAEEVSVLRGLLRTVGSAAPTGPAEVYDKAIELLHREERAFALSGGKFRRPFTRLVTERSTFRYPGIFNDYNNATKDDDEELLRIHESNLRLLEDARERHADRGQRGILRAYLNKLVADMVFKTRKGRVALALDEATALDVVRGAKTDCSELSRYAYARLKLAGFKPRTVFQRIPADELNPDAVRASEGLHLLLAVPDPEEPTRNLYIDLTADGFVKQPQRRMYLSPTTAMGVYHYGVGLGYETRYLELKKAVNQSQAAFIGTLLGRIVIGAARLFAGACAEEAIRRFDKAIRHDPSHGMFYYGKAHALWKTGAPGSAVRETALEAVRRLPDFESARQLYSMFSRE